MSARSNFLTLVVILSVLLIWFGTVIVRLENENYALLVGLCGQDYNVADVQTGLERARCLEEVETRTSPLWHLYYTLSD